MNYLIQNSIIDSSWSYDGNYNQSGIGWERNSESESSAYVFKMNECVQPWVISEAVRLVSNRSCGVGRIESRCERVKLLFFLFQAVGRNPTCRRGSERIEPDSNTPTQSQIRILITTNSPQHCQLFRVRRNQNSPIVCRPDFPSSPHSLVAVAAHGGKVLQEIPCHINVRIIHLASRQCSALLKENKSKGKSDSCAKLMPSKWCRRTWRRAERGQRRAQGTNHQQEQGVLLACAVESTCFFLMAE